MGRLVRFRSGNRWYDSSDGHIRTQNGRSLGRTRVQVSAHYIVGQSGDIVQCVHDNDIAWHASAVNGDSLGIEHCASNVYHNPPVQAQYEASARLVCWLCNQYGIPLDRDHIVGHAEASPQDNHDCPSAAWDWDTYMQSAQRLCVSRQWRCCTGPVVCATASTACS